MPGPSPHAPRHGASRQLFLVLLALLLLAAFHACSRRHIGDTTRERPYAVPALPIVGRAFAVDGDTLHIGGERIRLADIDAPERDQSCTGADGRAWPCGLAATRQLKDRIRGQSVTCRPRARDRYGRAVATCSLADGSDINAWMVRQGWALASGFGGAYAGDEAQARTQKRGIWAGSFVAPREWRRRNGRASREGLHPGNE